MELMELFKAALIGIVQGITEWLPVSSTGHMILFNEFIKMNVSETFMSTFLVVIQFGSILAVLTIFFKKLNPFDSSKTKIQKNETIDLWIKVIIAVIPSGILGLLFDDTIDALFFNPTTVAIYLDVPSKTAPIIVEPDLDVPGIKAKHWNKPIPIANL